MVEKISIQNYKSIVSLEVTLGRVNVLIGENGCGKTNILEALALISAAIQMKLDSEFLASRGIRVSEANFMRSAFNKAATKKDIVVGVSGNGTDFGCNFKNDNKPYSKWHSIFKIGTLEEVTKQLKKTPPKISSKINHEDNFKILKEIIFNKDEHYNLRDYVIYSPENKDLRTFEKEEQIEPLGINGEGLFKLLKYYNESDTEKIKKIKSELELIDWFQDFNIPKNHIEFEKNLLIKDKYINEKLPLFNQKSVNEGFLFLLFYVTLLISEKTPKFFAVDNIEASLNPKLCTELMKKIVSLSKSNNKQVILTTHNPAILDGLNLNDPAQKLFVVSRSIKGYTKIKEVEKPRVSPDETPIRLSEAFLNGMLGGLPKSF
jgi:predicted ATPase